MLANYASKQGKYASKQTASKQSTQASSGRETRPTGCLPSKCLLACETTGMESVPPSPSRSAAQQESNLERLLEPNTQKRPHMSSCVWAGCLRPCCVGSLYLLHSACCSVYCLGAIWGATGAVRPSSNASPREKRHICGTLRGLCGETRKHVQNCGVAPKQASVATAFPCGATLRSSDSSKTTLVLLFADECGLG